MLSRGRRLRADEVRNVIATGCPARAGVVSAKYLALQGPFRCAAVVSKKVAKTAVARNRIRRCVYAAVDATATPKNKQVVLFVNTRPKKINTHVFTPDIITICSKLT